MSRVTRWFLVMMPTGLRIGEDGEAAPGKLQPALDGLIAS